MWTHARGTAPRGSSAPVRWAPQRSPLRIAWDEADGHRDGLVTNDGADDGRPVSVVLGVVRGVDGRMSVGPGVAEGDVAFHPARADASGAAGLRPAVPG